MDPLQYNDTIVTYSKGTEKRFYNINSKLDLNKLIDWDVNIFNTNIGTVTYIHNTKTFTIILDNNNNIFHYLEQLVYIDWFYKNHINFMIIDICQQNLSGYTPLYNAIINRNIIFINYLLSIDIDINYVNDDGWSALYYAVYYNKYAIVKLLLSQKCNIVQHDKYTKPISCIAAETFINSEIIDLLMKYNMDINATYLRDDIIISAMHVAVTQNNLDCVRKLIECGAKPIDRCYPLFEAAKNGRCDIAELLLLNGENPMFGIPWDGGERPIQQIEYCYSSLSIAVEYNRLDILKLFDKYNFDLNHLDENNASLPGIAAREGNFEILEYLGNKGVPMDIQDSLNTTPLLEATWWGCEKCVEIILRYNVNVNNIDEWFEMAPLHIATENNNASIVRQLIKHKVNINSTCIIDNTQLYTPLHIAMFYTDYDILELLIAHGADETIINSDNETPLMIAQSENNLHTIEKLNYLIDQRNRNWPDKRWNRRKLIACALLLNKDNNSKKQCTTKKNILYDKLTRPEFHDILFHVITFL